MRRPGSCFSLLIVGIISFFPIAAHARGVMLVNPPTFLFNLLTIAPAALGFSLRIKRYRRGALLLLPALLAILEWQRIDLGGPLHFTACYLRGQMLIESEVNGFYCAKRTRDGGNVCTGGGQCEDRCSKFPSRFPVDEVDRRLKGWRCSRWIMPEEVDTAAYEVRDSLLQVTPWKRYKSAVPFCHG